MLTHGFKNDRRFDLAPAGAIFDINDIIDISIICVIITASMLSAESSFMPAGNFSFSEKPVLPPERAALLHKFGTFLSIFQVLHSLRMNSFSTSFRSSGSKADLGKLEYILYPDHQGILCHNKRQKRYKLNVPACNSHRSEEA